MATCSPASTRSADVCTSTGTGHAVDEPAQQLAPVVLVGHVLERDTRVHLPAPRVVDRERQRLAAPVALEGEHRLRRCASHRCRSRSTVAPGLSRLDRVDADERRQLVPAIERCRFGRRDLGQRVSLAGARRPHLQRATPTTCRATRGHAIELRPAARPRPACPRSRLPRTTSRHRASAARRRAARRTPQSCAADRR